MKGTKPLHTTTTTTAAAAMNSHESDEWMNQY